MISLSFESSLSQIINIFTFIGCIFLTVDSHGRVFNNFGVTQQHSFYASLILRPRNEWMNEQRIYILVRFLFSSAKEKKVLISYFANDNTLEMLSLQPIDSSSRIILECTKKKTSEREREITHASMKISKVYSFSSGNKCSSPNQKNYDRFNGKAQAVTGIFNKRLEFVFLAFARLSWMKFWFIFSLLNQKLSYLFAPFIAKIKTSFFKICSIKWFIYRLKIECRIHWLAKSTIKISDSSNRIKTVYFPAKFTRWI